MSPFAVCFDALLPNTGDSALAALIKEKGIVVQ